MQIKTLNYGYDTVKKIVNPYVRYDEFRSCFCIFATAVKADGITYTVILKMFASKTRAQKYLRHLNKKLGAEVIENDK